MPVGESGRVCSVVSPFCRDCVFIMDSFLVDNPVPAVDADSDIEEVAWGTPVSQHDQTFQAIFFDPETE